MYCSGNFVYCLMFHLISFLVTKMYGKMNGKSIQILIKKFTKMIIFFDENYYLTILSCFFSQIVLFWFQIDIFICDFAYMNLHTVIWIEMPTI